MQEIYKNWQQFSESYTKEHEKELEEIVGELENASKMHASQAERIQKVLDATDNDKLEEEVIEEKLNCGCGNDPCETYGDITIAAATEIVEQEIKAILDEKKKKSNKICAKGKAWAKRTFDTYPSAYANLAASKYCKDPNYAKGSKKKSKKNEEISPELEEGELQKWLDQDWKRIDSAGNVKGDCGTSKNKKNPDRCLPASKAKSMSKGERAATAKKKKKAQKTGKDSGKTSYVANTKKGKVTTKENLELKQIIEEEIEAVLSEKKKKTDKERMKCNSPRRIRQGEAGHGKKKFVVKACDGGTEKIIRYGDANMEIKKDSPKRRKSFRARHNCKNPGSKLKARYWSCKKW